MKSNMLNKILLLIKNYVVVDVFSVVVLKHDVFIQIVFHCLFEKFVHFFEYQYEKNDVFIRENNFNENHIIMIV